jgi:hypothetical protein
MTAGADIQLSDTDVLAAWGAATGAPPVVRAVAVAARAAPERAAVRDWTIGRRDGLLLDVHAAVFGSAIDLVTACPECGEALELTLAVDDVRSPYGDAGAKHEVVDAASGTRVVFRLPSSADLLAVAAIEDIAAARLALAQRCVVRGEAALPETAVAALAARVAELDPQADIELALVCAECGHGWTVPFDVADHVWRRIDARARTLVAEVAALAGAFGWTEPEILGLPAGRRRLYLELVGA